VAATRTNSPLEVMAEPLEGSYFVSTYPPFSTWSGSARECYRAALANESTADVPLGLYAHIPFCDLRCRYCYYLSQANPAADSVESYLDCLEVEMALLGASPALRHRELSFIYFGGGTPSMLLPDQIERLMAFVRRSFTWAEGAEVTFECAPRTVGVDRLAVLRQCGVTRLSLGVQQLDDEVLSRNGRVHTVSDVEKAVECIQSVGFDVVNLDLIVGLVGETEDTFFRSLGRVIEMDPQSVTLYQLEIPFNTPLARAVRSRRDSLAIPSWETKRRRLDAAFRRLEGAGYFVRSAYAAVRNPSQHGFVYQDSQYRGADLVGAGASAFSYLSGVHHQNLASVRDYSTCLGRGDLPLYRAHALSADEQMVRQFVLQLKLGGCRTGAFRRSFDVDPLERFAQPLSHFEGLGWVEADADAVRVTREGLLRVDRMIPAFYNAEHQTVRYS